MADNDPITVGELVRIPSSRKRITFKYSGLSLAVPERVRFRYSLDSFDRGWSGPTAVREAVYTNLSPGSYRFHVVASNSYGQWNDSEAAVSLEVDPAFWQTWWIRVSCVAVFMALLWMLYRMRLRQVAHQFNMRLEERVNERTRIARELHDTLLQSFQAVLLKFHAVTYLLPDRPAEARERLETVIDQAQEAITEGRDAVQGLRSSTVVANELSQALGALGEELAADQAGQTGEPSPDFRVIVEGTLRNLAPIVRDEVYRIAGESLRNAFRHAKARRIEVEILYGRRELKLWVRDNGKGIDPKILEAGVPDGHYGMVGIRERAVAETFCYGASCAFFRRPLFPGTQGFEEYARQFGATKRVFPSPSICRHFLGDGRPLRVCTSPVRSI